MNEIRPIPRTNKPITIQLGDTNIEHVVKPTVPELDLSTASFTNVSTKKKEKKKEEKEEEKEEEEEEKEEKEEEEKEEKEVFERTTPVPIVRYTDDELETIMLGDTNLKDRLGEVMKSVNSVSRYYLDNREVFTSFLHKLFSEYKEEILQEEDTNTCEQQMDKSKPFTLLTHQKIVRDYLSLYTPYRGLLLFHGLGSGKTCSSIAIAEGLKADKQVLVLSPASLEKNFRGQISFCGDPIYKTNQFWEFVSIDEHPEYKTRLSRALSLPEEFIEKYHGAWMIDASKSPNYKDLPEDDRMALDKQIAMMVDIKYKFIHSNGLRMDTLTKKLGAHGNENPFDNKVVIIDEAHNLIGNISNSMGKESIAQSIYQLLLHAKGCRIVLLTGTPLINTPNELGILYNIIRGMVTTWNFRIQLGTKSFSYVQEELSKLGVIDYMNYVQSSRTMEITRCPWGFINVMDPSYKGIRVDENGQLDDDTFQELVESTLSKIGIKVQKESKVLSKSLPDKNEEFRKEFVDRKGNIINELILKRRILGMTSYVPDITKLMPHYSGTFHVVRIDMSDYQFSIYSAIRNIERKDEIKMARRLKLGEEPNSTYRIYSRFACNFVFPDEIKRPTPNDIEMGYDEIKETTLQQLKEHPELFRKKGLQKYSPKFLHILDNIQDPDHEGLHLFYSDFKTFEGITGFKLVLNDNGFAEFKLKKLHGEWVPDIAVEDMDKPKYGVYTGDEDESQRDISRKIFNGEWDSLNSTLKEYLKKYTNNRHGEVMKVFMITKAGAEGISLQNVRYVHMNEPYWHNIRLEQVIGRANRLCSHMYLPEEERNVIAFLYVMHISQEQYEHVASVEMKTKDIGEEGEYPITTDENLLEAATRKERVNKQLLRCIKESSIDCFMHGKDLNC